MGSRHSTRPPAAPRRRRVQRLSAAGCSCRAAPGGAAGRCGASNYYGGGSEPGERTQAGRGWGSQKTRSLTHSASAPDGGAQAAAGAAVPRLEALWHGELVQSVKGRGWARGRVRSANISVWVVVDPTKSKLKWQRRMSGRGGPRDSISHRIRTVTLVCGGGGRGGERLNLPLSPCLLARSLASCVLRRRRCCAHPCPSPSPVHFKKRPPATVKINGCFAPTSLSTRHGPQRNGPVLARGARADPPISGTP